MATLAPPPRRVFISYASPDHKLAERMVEYLERADISCWFAPREIKVGQEWAQRLREGLAGCYAVVVFVTEAADESVHVARELTIAIKTRRPILPLLLAGFQPARLEYVLETVHHLVLENRTALSPALAQQVCERLQELADSDRETPIPTEAETRAVARAVAEPSDATLWRVYASGRSRLVLLTAYGLSTLVPVLVPGSIESGLKGMALVAGAALVVATRRLNLPALLTLGFVQPVFMVAPVALQAPLFVLQSIAEYPPWQYSALWAAGGLIASFRFGALTRHAFSVQAWRAWIAPHWTVLGPMERVEAVVNVLVLAAGVALTGFSLWYANGA